MLKVMCILVLSIGNSVILKVSRKCKDVALKYYDTF